MKTLKSAALILDIYWYNGKWQINMYNDADSSSNSDLSGESIEMNEKHKPNVTKSKCHT